MLNNRRYEPDKLKPLIPPPPPVHPNAKIDRQMMVDYAMKRYFAQLFIDTGSDK